eukprot:TRINITY_DN4108_c0_g1_i3.p1 TRINITY_DN4108_c0_g1~~TRINITY_DN4108_c0_g1_i3.p1  ORF type:complete len:404 (-),score=41.04 TRINITY_DN4108_c0_g1_i3:172-1320(-)
MAICAFLLLTLGCMTELREATTIAQGSVSAALGRAEVNQVARASSSGNVEEVDAEESSLVGLQRPRLAAVSDRMGRSPFLNMDRMGSGHANRAREQLSATARSYLLSIPNRDMFLDGRPVLFVNRVSGERAIVCLNAKVGSTRWKQLLLHGMVSGGLHQIHGMKIAHQEELIQAFADPSVPRYMFVRNPYSRLVSGFEDKIVGENQKGGLAGYKRGSPFSDFVDAMLPNSSENKHFKLLSEQCGVDRGVLYDSYLRLEQTRCWYSNFLATMGLQRFASHGWMIARKSKFLKTHNKLPALGAGDDCYYRAPGCTCSSMIHGCTGRASVASDRSTSALASHFTASLAAKVTRWAATDLAEFGYPAYEGASAVAYQERISTCPRP